MSELRPDFFNTQFKFTAHIRDPENQPVPSGIEARRMNIYSELFYNNIEGFLSSAFPVIKAIYSEENWHKMARDFFVHHRCQTPYFLEISEEFISYLQNTRQPQAEDPAFLLELAHYEWVELALMVSDETIDLSGIDPNGDLLSQHPQLSGLCWSLAYQYPVHKIGPDFIPDSAPEQATYIVVYRNRNDEIEFLEISPVTARLIQLLSENQTITGRQALTRIADELDTDAELIISKGFEALQELQKDGIILGSSATPA